MERSKTPTHEQDDLRPHRPTRGRIRLPKDGARELSQDEEWFELRDGSDWRRIRFHDYDEIYDVPGLYEELFYEHLRCSSPERMRRMLEEVLKDNGEKASELRLLDVGAGNGMVGEEFAALGVPHIVGVDILPEAREAALRDRSQVYDAYHAVDLTDLPEDVEADLRSRRFNCMTCVAALGFGDIPVDAFLKALETVGVPGWVAFNIKEDFLAATDDTGFDKVVRDLIRGGVLRVESYRRYRHRDSVSGKPLYYAAIVARKRSSVKAWRASREGRGAGEPATSADGVGGIFSA